MTSPGWRAGTSRTSEREIAAFVVDDEYHTEKSFQGLPLHRLSEVERLFPPTEYDMFIALSYRNINRDREAKFKMAKKMGYALPGYVNSRCSYLSEEPPGENCFILEDNTIQPFVKIGDNVTLWSGNHVGHDVVIGDHVFISSHVVISGHVTIGNNCFLGINATLRNGITTASHTVIGAGALVMKSTREKQVYLGKRCKPFPRNSDEIEL